MGLTTHVIRGANAERLLFLLHGLGADERDLAQLVPYLDPGERFVTVFPRGAYAAPPGYAWFKFGPQTLTEGTMASSVDAVEGSIGEACERFGMRREEMILGGFSQGAALATVLATRPSPEPKPAGVLAMSGFRVPTERFPVDTGQLPPVLAQHGTEDPVVPLEAGREAARALADAGAPVVWKTYRMEHQVTLDSIRDATAWIDDVLAGERPDDPPPPGEEPAGAAAPSPTDAVPPEDDALVKQVSQATFEREVLQADRPVIVDFWAPWCQPCHQIAPIVEQIAAMRKGSYKVVKLNIDEAPQIAQRYEIQSIPLVALFRNGRLERRSLGVKARPQLEAELGMLVIP